MNAPILVTGGTGNIGRRVVPLLRAAGRDVRILSRHTRADEAGIQYLEGDTVAGAGLAEAFAGIETVLHLAGGAKGDDIAARHVAAAARSAGTRHLILISVIGAELMPIGYFRAKASAERTIAESGIPWTILRAAQLHEFVLPVVKLLAGMPLVPAPRGLRFEPVHGDEVAARLAELTLGAPAGLVPDIAGPEVLDVPQLVGTYNALRGRRRQTLPFRLPGAVGQAYRMGHNLAHEGALRGERGWEEFLTQRAGTPSGVSRP
jgi:uncharacterized protein YbjT (DUF2867 family)